MEINVILAAVLGWLASIFVDISSKNKTLKSFKFKAWFNKQFWRLLVSAVCVIAGVLFTDDIFGVEITAFWAFLAAFSNDVILFILNDKKAKLMGLKSNRHVCTKDCPTPCPKASGTIRPGGSGGRP